MSDEPEPDIDDNWADNYEAHRDEVHRHIGAIVRVAAHLEDEITALITLFVDSRSPRKVRPLIQGRRLSELIDTLSQVMPNYSDKAALIKALRAVNSHRDRLAHSTAGFEPGDFSNFGVAWIDRQGRSTRTAHKLDVAAFREVERDHALVLLIIECFELGVIFAEERVEADSILHFVNLTQSSAHAHPLDAAGKKDRVVEILDGAELMAGFLASDSRKP